MARRVQPEPLMGRRPWGPGLFLVLFFIDIALYLAAAVVAFVNPIVGLRIIPPPAPASAQPQEAVAILTAMSNMMTTIQGQNNALEQRLRVMESA